MSERPEETGAEARAKAERALAQEMERTAQVQEQTKVYAAQGARLRRIYEENGLRELLWTSVVRGGAR